MSRINRHIWIIIQINCVCVSLFAVTFTAEANNIYEGWQQRFELLDNRLLVLDSIGQTRIKHVFHSTVNVQSYKQNIVSTSKVNFSSSVKSATLCKFILDTIGFSHFRSSKGAIEVNFDNLTISSGAASIMLSDSIYTEVESKFTQKGIFIKCSINRNELYFAFDTGYQGTFVIPTVNSEKYFADNYSENGHANPSPSHNSKSETYYSNRSVKFFDIYYSTGITVSPNSAAAKVGVGFLKGFNWIFDFDHKKVYAKKNYRSIDLNDRIQCMDALQIVNSQLIILKKQTSDHRYQIGDEIISINGVSINVGNICEQFNYLTLLESWDNIVLEIRK